MRRFAFLSILAVAVYLGCGGGSSTSTGGMACIPGDQKACPCPGGFMGAQACLPDGNGYSTCDGCGGGSASSSSGSTSSGSTSSSGAGGGSSSTSSSASSHGQHLRQLQQRHASSRQRRRLHQLQQRRRLHQLQQRRRLHQLQQRRRLHQLQQRRGRSAALPGAMRGRHPHPDHDRRAERGQLHPLSGRAQRRRHAALVHLRGRPGQRLADGLGGAADVRRSPAPSVELDDLPGDRDVPGFQLQHRRHARPRPDLPRGRRRASSPCRSR